jgi:hypothetical protein
MTKRTQTLKDSLPIVAAALGDKLNVRVSISGEGAWTDSKRINLPLFDIETKNDRDALLGYLSHEASHIKFNSFDVDDPHGELDFIDEHTPKNPMLFSLVNAVEDIRCENLMLKTLAGTESWMNATLLKLVQDGAFKPQGSDDHPASIFHGYILRYLRVNFRNQDFIQDQLDELECHFLNVLGYDLFLKVNEIMNKKMPSTASANDTFAIGKALYQCIVDEDNNEDEDSDDNQSSSGQGDSDEDSDENQSSSGQGDSKQKKIQRAIKSIVEDDNQDYDNGIDSYKNLMETIASNSDTSAAESFTIIPALSPLKHGHKGSRIMAKAKVSSHALTVKLQSLVQDALREKSFLSQTGLDLSNRDLYRYSVGDPNLFDRSELANGIDTVVEVTLDNSGSMGSHADSEGLIVPAREAQLALVSALDKISQVSTTASLFPLDFGDSMMMNDRSLQDAPLNLKSESDSVKTLANNLARYANGRGFSTPSATAMWNSINNVLKSKRNRKVILFITDGLPDEEQVVALHKLVKKAEKEGIIIIGIGIGYLAKDKESLSQIFSKAIYIQDAKDLKKELFKVTKNLLIG